MAALDPFDMLVRLGKITQAQLQAAELVEAGVGTSTSAARLVAVGVDKKKLLESLSELTRMPVAPPEALAAAGPMQLPESYSAIMKELLAVPIGRIDEHILDVAIADPRTTKKLRDAAIAHHPRLALESDVIEALSRVFPESAVLDPLHEPTLKNVPLAAPRPISVVDGAAVEKTGARAVPPPLDMRAPRTGAAKGSGAPSAIVDGAGAPVRAGDAAPPVDGAARAADDAVSPVLDDDVAPLDDDGAGLDDDEAPLAGHVGVLIEDAAPVAGTPRTHAEVTQRVRLRSADDPGTTAPAPFPPPQVRELVVHARNFVIANVDARKLVIAATIAVIVAGLVLTRVVCASATDVALDAGVALDVDAGLSPPAVANPTPPTIDAGTPTDAGTPVKKRPAPPKKPPHKPKKKKGH